MIVERNVCVPMRDGVRLAADIWRHSGDRLAPVLVSRTRYGRKVLAVGSALEVLVAAGFAVVLQDCQGRLGSDGDWRYFSCEVNDGYETIRGRAHRRASRWRGVQPVRGRHPGTPQWHSRALGARSGLPLHRRTRCGAADYPWLSKKRRVGMPNSPTVEQPEIWRIFTGEDGKSRRELLDIKMNARGASGLASAVFAATGVQAIYIPPDMEVGWHNAPARQIVATIAGEGELETGDGQVLVLRPGVMTVVEDLEGDGHLTRPRGSAGRLVLFIPLGEGVDLG